MSTAAVIRRPVLADLIPGRLARDVTLVAAGAGLTGLSAQFSFLTPLSPVPFTLQTLAVLVTGAALGSVRGVLSMLVYLAAGVAGVPWFAGHAHGWAANPSFGYVIGFVVAAGIAGALARRGADRSVVATVGLMVAGIAVIYTTGTAWLAVDQHITAGQAFTLGVRPFLVADVLKIAVAALAFPMAWKVARH